MSGCQRSGSTWTVVPSTEALTESQTEVWERISKMPTPPTPPAAEKVQLEKKKKILQASANTLFSQGLGFQLLISKVIN